jgi:threonine dehydrogenase-like Zn-dependent dehydrogenase
MRAVITEGVEAMHVRDVEEPPPPGPGQVLLRPTAVGLCGSDFHFYDGGLSPEAGGDLFPRIQGHEVAATVEAVGDAVRLETGQPVAVMPITSCGECYPCSVGRGNACDNFSLIGIHTDGGLQDLFTVAADKVFPTAVSDPAVAALSEPVSIAVRAVRRGRVEAGETVVVLGAGPIGQSVCLAALDRDARVLVVDLLDTRLDLARAMGADAVVWSDDLVAYARDWSGGEGPAVVVDATGVPQAVRAAVDMAASAARVVQVGMSVSEVSLRIGSFTEKELDMLGVSCCGGGDFAEAVALVERNAGLLDGMVSHRFPLEGTPEALVYAMQNPTEVMKVVISPGGE